MGAILGFLEEYYTFYAMVLVVGSGLFALLVDQKDMVKKKLQREATISKIAGLTYIWGGILLYIIELFAT